MAVWASGGTSMPLQLASQTPVPAPPDAALHHETQGICPRFVPSVNTVNAPPIRRPHIISVLYVYSVELVTLAVLLNYSRTSRTLFGSVSGALINVEDQYGGAPSTIAPVVGEWTSVQSLIDQSHYQIVEIL
ncbi:hypothetical protein F4824DRAFT_504515 [Ustulina deusta]|nr:hypothetical protein F4824DRAFT_504515 [Ustulina deusta]